MAVVQIEESDLLAKNNLARHFEKLMGNPKARKLVQQATKEVDPTAVIPEIDSQTEVLGEVANIRAELAAMRKADEDRRTQEESDKRLQAFQNSWNGQKEKLRSQGWQDEGITAIENLAQERNLADLEAAAALFEKIHPPSNPVSPASLGLGGFDLMTPPENDAKDIEALVKGYGESRSDDNSALSHLINSALNDVRQGGRR